MALAAELRFVFWDVSLFETPFTIRNPQMGANLKMKNPESNFSTQVPFLQYFPMANQPFASIFNELKFYIWVFPKIMVPPNHPFVHRVFHYKSSVLGVKSPYFWFNIYIMTSINFQPYDLCQDGCLSSLPLQYRVAHCADTIGASWLNWWMRGRSSDVIDRPKPSWTCRDETSDVPWRTSCSERRISPMNFRDIYKWWICHCHLGWRVLYLAIFGRQEKGQFFVFRSQVQKYWLFVSQGYGRVFVCVVLWRIPKKLLGTRDLVGREAGLVIAARA